MKITITQDFDSAEAAAEFLARVGNPAVVINGIAGPVPPTPEKPARKPRNDAGKPREPYGPRTTEAKAGEAGAPSGTPSTATSGQVPAASAAAPTAASPAAASAADPDFPPTLEGARKAMAALNATAGKGMDACIQALKSAGVNRISDLPKEKYPEFIKDVLAESSAEGIASAKKAPAKK